MPVPTVRSRTFRRMSRSNPYRQPRRKVQATAILVVEGETEEAFCKHLKGCYNRNCGLRVTIRNARGWGPDHIVEAARKTCQQASFDRVFIWMDGDQPIRLEKTHRTIRSLEAVVLRSSPCVEGFFLRMMGQAVPQASSQCKDRFHRVGLSEDQKLEPERYAGLFPAARLEAIRASHSLLDNLIKLFSNVPIQ
jgi:hypothetical protein